MPKVFFSYAYEDRDVVEAVYTAVAKDYPQHEPWMDKYEIVAGQSLLDKIADGMDAAEKFFVFLSAVSIARPWVKRELQRALMREIDGVDPDYIVPVKLADVVRVPAFLEGKRYIDLARLRREEWLNEFDAAIRGAPTSRVGAESAENVEVRIEPGPEGPHVAHLHFHATMWAEEFSFVVQTKEDLAPLPDGPAVIMELLVGSSFALTKPRFRAGPRFTALGFEAPDLRPGRPICMRLRFAPGVDAVTAVESISAWPRG
jgi:hypothetical protein